MSHDATGSVTMYPSAKRGVWLIFVYLVLVAVPTIKIEAQTASLYADLQNESAQSSSSTALPKLEGETDQIKFWLSIVSLISSIVAILVVVFSKTLPWAKAKIDSHKISKNLGRDFPKEDVEKSIKYYIHPFCQDIDPSGGEEPRAVVPVQEKLFDSLDKFVRGETEYSFIILLADSGMGKTSALIKYYLRHNRWWRRQLRNRHKLKLIALGNPKAVESIEQVEDKLGTVLLLDAFDEDTDAISDHSTRLDQILDASREFPRVLISCRTQFFPKEEEIPTETGILKLGPRSAGDSAQHKFHKLFTVQ